MQFDANLEATNVTKTNERSVWARAHLIDIVYLNPGDSGPEEKKAKGSGSKRHSKAAAKKAKGWLSE